MCEERNTNVAVAARRRAAQRDRPPREPERHRPGAPRARAAIAVGAGRPDRPHPQRHPRPHRRARRRPTSSPRSAAARAGHARPTVPARPAQPRGCGRSWPSRSRSTRWPRRSSGSAARCSTIVRIDRPRGHTSVDDGRGRPGRAGRRSAAAGRPTGPLVGVGVAVVGIVRRVDGLVSMAPNLGWSDVPLGERLPRVLARPVPIAVANEADLGALAEHRRGAAGRRRQCAVHLGRGRRRRRPDRRRHSPLTGVAGLRRRGRPHAGQPGRAPCRCGSVGCWETEVGDGALLRRAGHAAEGGRREVDAVLREAAAGSRAALAALDEVGHWLGLGLAGLVNVFNPRPRRPRWAASGGSIRSSRATLEDELDRRALPAPRAWSVSSRRPRRGCPAGRRCRACIRAAPRRPGRCGSGRATGWPSWRAHDHRHRRPPWSSTP